MRKTGKKTAQTRRPAVHTTQAVLPPQHTPPDLRSPPQRINQIDLRIARRRSSHGRRTLCPRSIHPGRHQNPPYRGRRPGVATRSTFALPEGDPAGSTNPLPAQSSSRSPPDPRKITALPHRAVAAWETEAAASASTTVRGRHPGIRLPRPQSHPAHPSRSRCTARIRKLQGDASNKVVTRTSPSPAPDGA